MQISSERTLRSMPRSLWLDPAALEGVGCIPAIID
jgi:hypothetical protein